MDWFVSYVYHKGRREQPSFHSESCCSMGSGCREELRERDELRDLELDLDELLETDLEAP